MSQINRQQGTTTRGLTVENRKTKKKKKWICSEVGLSVNSPGIRRVGPEEEKVGYGYV